MLKKLETVVGNHTYNHEASNYLSAYFKQSLTLQIECEVKGIDNNCLRFKIFECEQKFYLMKEEN